jgi:hypothetical protein
MGNRAHFCFESEAWKSVFGPDNVIILDQVFRQKETKFLGILHELRRGEVSASSRMMLAEKAREYSLKQAIFILNIEPFLFFLLKIYFICYFPLQLV